MLDTLPHLSIGSITSVRQSPFLAPTLALNFFRPLRPSSASHALSIQFARSFPLFSHAYQFRVRNSIALISLQNNRGVPLPSAKTQVTQSKQFRFSLGARTAAETFRRPVRAATCAIVFLQCAGSLDSGSAAVRSQVSTGFQCAGCGEWNETSVDAAAGAGQTYVEDCQVCCKPNVLHATWDRETGEYEIQAELE